MKSYHEDYFNNGTGITILILGYVAMFIFGYDYYFGDKIFVSEGPLKFYLAMLFGINSLWMTGRLIASKMGTIRITNNSLKSVLIKNIIAPIIVSLVVYTITGSSTITFYSIPLFGAISASIGI